MRKHLQKGAHTFLGDVLRKVPISGVGEIRVPSDVRRVIVRNIENLRESALDIFAKEISKVLAKLDVDDLLNNYTIRLEARVDLVPKRRKGQAGKRAKKGKP
jgi:hypothetical protein